MGFHTAKPMKYTNDYFEAYQKMDASEMGFELTAARMDLVDAHTEDKPVDIGIGGGLFVREFNCQGYDVNESAVNWLIDSGRYTDPYAMPIDAITCWDSLEHIKEPEKLLNKVRGWVFVSLPIFENAEHCLNSKHFKPGEHIWYFTHDGFMSFMASQGFILKEYNQRETEIGREGISSYAFKRA
tara:strand:- start:94 stop:645 length:552 start_codon:yes stop_codon:yes gene_type:complete